MSTKYGMNLVRSARLTRRQLIGFALVSAAINGIVTATVGAWLAQTYSQYQSRRTSVENIGNLFYARRTRAGMVASSLRRNAALDEVVHRKQAYDEAYVDWNTNIRKNLFVIRDVMGQANFSKLEQSFEDDLVAALSEMDRCLTKAYDERVASRDPVAILNACKMADLYQFALDCGATYTNELFKLSRLSFIPLANREQDRLDAEGRIKKGCTRPASIAPAAPSAAPAATPEAPRQVPASPPMASQPAPAEAPPVPALVPPSPAADTQPK